MEYPELRVFQHISFNIHLSTYIFNNRDAGKREGRVASLMKENITVLVQDDITEGLYSEVIWMELRSKKG